MWLNFNFLIYQGEKNPSGLCTETFRQFQDIKAHGVSAKCLKIKIYCHLCHKAKP